MSTSPELYLRELVTPADATLDIVAIHGIDPTDTGDHGMKTWESPATGKMWLKDFLPDALPKARIMVFGWNSRVVLEASISSLRDHAESLLHRLGHKRNGAGKRPILFVCHSLGGLLVKRALVIAKSVKKFASIYYATYGLVFFGTPHNGGNGVDFGNFLSYVVRKFSNRAVRNTLLESCKKDGALAGELKEDFRQQLTDFMVVNFYEDKHTIVLKKDVGLVVDKSSATLGLPTDRESVLPLGRDHSSICKFDAKDDTYELVEQEMVRLANEAEECISLAERLPQPNADAWNLPLLELRHQAETLHSADALHSRTRRLEEIQNRLEEIRKWLEVHGGVTRQFESIKEPTNFEHSCTGAWLLHDSRFRHWQSEANSWLWLHGIPGCGKTVLNASTLRHLHGKHVSNPGNFVIHFYFEFTSRSSVQKMLCSLLLQLMDQLVVQNGEQLPPALKKLWASECRDGTRSPTIKELMQALHDILASEACGAVYILLDALDECEGVDQPDIEDALRAIHGWAQKEVHVFITSRLGNRVAESLEDVVAPDHRIEIEAQMVDEDIKTWLVSQLHNGKLGRKIRRWRNLEQLKAKIVGNLLSQSGGMFLLARLRIELLERNCSSVHEVNKRLESLPADLYKTFDRILSEIEDSDRAKATAILRWLVFAERALRVEETEWVAAFSEGESPELTLNPDARIENGKDEILRICSSMVRLVNEQQPRGLDQQQDQQQVQLAHSTVKEYLLSKRDPHLPDLWFSSFEVQAAQSMIAEASLTYLLHCCQPESLQVDRQHKEQKAIHFLGEWSLAAYAARFWTIHARLSGEVSCKFNGTSTLHRKMHLLTNDETILTNWVRIFDPSEPSEMPDFSKFSSDVNGAWYYASLCGLTSLVDLLRPENDIDAHAGFHGTALQAACFGGFVDTVEYLLDNGAGLMVRPREDPKDALHVASYAGRNTIVKLLLERGALATSFGGFFGYALQAAAYQCHEQTVKLLLDAGAEVNAYGGNWDSALIAASWSGGVGTVKILLDHGADVNYMSAKVTTALQAASCDGRLQVVEALLARRADPNLLSTAETWYGTALCAAASHGFSSIAERLVAAGARVDLGGGKYATPLIAAVSEGRVETVKWLLDIGADLSVEGVDGKDVWAALDESRLTRIIHSEISGLLREARDANHKRIGLATQRLQSIS